MEWEAAPVEDEEHTREMVREEVRLLSDRVSICMCSGSWRRGEDGEVQGEHEVVVTKSGLNIPNA